MKLYPAITVMSLLLSPVARPSLSAQTSGTVEEQFRKQYVGSRQMLRKFYDSGHLKFDAQGDFTGKAAIGSWTLFGSVNIEHLNLTDNLLVLDGHRNMLVFSEDGKRLQRRKTDRWTAEIATQRGPGQPGQIESALRKVFLTDGEDVATILPDYWQDYMERFNGRRVGGKPCARPQTGDANHKVNMDALPRGVLKGKKIYDVPPDYLAVASTEGVRGEIRFSSTISRSGENVNLCLIRALGGGLDDEAARVVRLWKYQPYTLNGELVEVDTVITMKFGMQPGMH